MRAPHSILDIDTKQNLVLKFQDSELTSAKHTDIRPISQFQVHKIVFMDPYLESSASLSDI